MTLIYCFHSTVAVLFILLSVYLGFCVFLTLDEIPRVGLGLLHPSKETDTGEALDK